jgi:hypothetical protein
MHIATITVDKTWRKVEDVVSRKIGTAFTFEDDIVYSFQNQGDKNSILLQDYTSVPAENNEDGVILPPDNRYPCGFIKDSGELYARCLGGSSILHIESTEE